MNKTPRIVEYRNIGSMSYKAAWDYQTELFDGVIAEKIRLRKEERSDVVPPNYMLICEHPPVYTIGKSGKMENLLLTEPQLEERGIEFFKINRGGDITFHGPGQIVGYPILDLDQFFTDVHKYLRFLEEGVIRTLAEYGILAGRLEGLTGVWIDENDPERARKICAMGIKSSRWVTMHGLAFNVNTDLGYFNNIVPCGIDDKAVTSMEKELGRQVNRDEVIQKLLAHYTQLFDWTLKNEAT